MSEAISGGKWRWSISRLDMPMKMIGVTLIVAAIFLGLAIVDVREARSVADGWKQHSYEVISQTQKLSIALQDAEIGSRGYLLTGDKQFLAQFNKGANAAPREIAFLKKMTRDNATQQNNIGELAPILNRRLDILRKAIEDAVIGDEATALQLAKPGQGFASMSSVQSMLTEINRIENELLKQRVAQYGSATRQADIVIYALMVLIVGMVAYGVNVMITATRSQLRTQAAETERDLVRQLHEGLEAKVAERTGELNSALENLQTQVAERERAEAQVRHMQKIESIGQLTGGIAHDFNNMLAVVLGSLEIVKRRMKTDPGKAMAGIENAEEGARRAAVLTSRLLAFARQQPLAPEPVSANRLVSGMSELLRQTLGEQIEIETVLAGGLWKTHIDAPQLENAILNLCVNARDAMPDGGKLTIETHNCHLDEGYSASNDDVAAGQYVLVGVTDTGTGMSPEIIERAFDPFYTTKEVGKGTGLGLSQVHGFVKQSGGHIKIYSEQDEGTTVKIYLPRYFGDADEISPSTSSAEMPVAQDGEVVLVVEDETQVRQVSTELLRDLGYQVIEAVDGADALEKLAEAGRVDLIFTDIVMPGMTGRVMADEAAKQRENIKVLYTTGYTRNAVVHNGKLDPGTEFIAKPYSGAALAIKVRSVLDKS